MSCASCLCRVASLVLVLCACGKSDEWSRGELLAQRIAEESSSWSPKTDMIDLATITEFEWDKLYVFGLYPTREHILDRIGVAWPGVDEFDLSLLADTRALLVFVDGTRVVCACLPLNRTSFMPLVGYVIPHDSSRVAWSHEARSFGVPEVR